MLTTQPFLTPHHPHSNSYLSRVTCMSCSFREAISKQTALFPCTMSVAEAPCPWPPNVHSAPIFGMSNKTNKKFSGNPWKVVFLVGTPHTSETTIFINMACLRFVTQSVTLTNAKTLDLVSNEALEMYFSCSSTQGVTTTSSSRAEQFGWSDALSENIIMIVHGSLLGTSYL